MARTQPAIKKIMTDIFIANPQIIAMYDLQAGTTFEQEFSLVSLENIFFEIVAFGQWLLESLFDVFKAEAETAMAQQHIHSKEWYRQKALGFLFGVPVIDGTDKFNTTAMNDDDITLAKVISQAATIKMISSNGYGILRIKVASNDGTGELQQVPPAKFEALKFYMQRYVVDAGTQVKFTTGPADDLKLKIDVYYDPLVLSTSGARLDGTSNTPVQDEIEAFLRSIDFNGSFVKTDISSALRKIEGVQLAVIKEASSKYGQYGYDATGIENVGLIDEIRIADSGYMKIDQLEINYKVMPQ